MDPTWKNRMQMLMKRKKRTEIKETLERAISDWYLEAGIPEPLWKPDWWENGEPEQPGE